MSPKNFDAYAAYYDLLYAQKEYARESDFIDTVIREFLPEARSVGDIGCGTGVHDWMLAAKGYEVVGVDQSQAMIDIAEARRNQHPQVAKAPRFQVGDVKTFQLPARVDVIVSLFDVISYLPDYASFRATAGQVRNALQPGGLFIFDCWYGPAVYTQHPGTRIRKLGNDSITLTRVASAEFDHLHNRIDVNYDMFVERKSDRQIETFSEVHPMRCYFHDELVDLLAPFGFELAFARKWFTKEPPSIQTWSAMFGFRRLETAARGESLRRSRPV